MASEIGVQTIQHTNGTDAMTIDSSGRVLTPARPAFRAYADNGWSNLANNTWTTAPFDHVNYDIGSHYDTANYKFVAPVSGIYHFIGQAYFNPHTTLRLRFTVNGNEKSFIKQKFDTSGLNLQMSSHFQLVAGDEVKFFIRADSGANTGSDVYYAEAHTFFSGHLVG